MSPDEWVGGCLVVGSVLLFVLLTLLEAFRER